VTLFRRWISQPEVSRLGHDGRYAALLSALDTVARARPHTRPHTHTHTHTHRGIPLNILRRFLWGRAPLGRRQRRGVSLRSDGLSLLRIHSGRTRHRHCVRFPCEDSDAEAELVLVCSKISFLSMYTCIDLALGILQ
jgi:hypothetical protein